MKHTKVILLSLNTLKERLTKEKEALEELYTVLVKVEHLDINPTSSGPYGLAWTKKEEKKEELRAVEETLDKLSMYNILFIAKPEDGKNEEEATVTDIPEIAEEDKEELL